jgi:hypothetical protein
VPGEDGENVASGILTRDCISAPCGDLMSRIRCLPNICHAGRQVSTRKWRLQRCGARGDENAARMSINKQARRQGNLEDLEMIGEIN